MGGREENVCTCIYNIDKLLQFCFFVLLSILDMMTQHKFGDNCRAEIRACINLVADGETSLGRRKINLNCTIKSFCTTPVVCKNNITSINYQITRFLSGWIRCKNMGSLQ